MLTVLGRAARWDKADSALDDVFLIAPKPVRVHRSLKAPPSGLMEELKPRKRAHKSQLNYGSLL